MAILQPESLVAAATALLERYRKLKSCLLETRVATLSRGIGNQNGAVLIEADHATKAPADIGTAQTLALKTLSKAKYGSGTITTLTGSADAIDIALGDVFVLNRSGAVNAATLAAPTDVTDDNREIWIKNGTTQANTITVAGSGLGGSGTTYDVITFTNVAAANVLLRALGGKWHMIGGHLATVG